jgi:hypothetical protein
MWFHRAEGWANENTSFLERSKHSALGNSGGLLALAAKRPRRPQENYRIALY